MTTRHAISRHHRGNLREALITAGIELMELGGPDALTLRKCAARAGVSHAAPAYHFNGLASLKVAIIARGHQLFARAMRRARACAAPDPQAQLDAICQGYLDFAVSHSAVFRFMFQPRDKEMTGIDAVTRAEYRRDSSASYLILREACAPFKPIGASPLGTETMIWSLVHGYAMLFCGSQSSGPKDSPVPAFSEIRPMLELK